jgi:hypothetical protein
MRVRTDVGSEISRHQHFDAEIILDASDELDCMADL